MKLLAKRVYHANQLQLKCYVSHYLSDKWLKEPLDIVYPGMSNHLTTSEQNSLKLLEEKLFGKNNQSTYTNAYEANLFPPSSSDSNSNYTYFHPKPASLRGIDLLSVLLNVNTPAYAKKLWSRLSPGQQKDLSTFNADQVYIAQQQRRVWKAYELIKYLRRYGGKYSQNPYKIVNLYPWEIIKDKLRANTSVHEFEFDYYDLIIKEAFYRNSTRKAMHIFYTDLKHTNPGRYTHKQVEKLFMDLPRDEVNYYLDKERRRSLHAQKSRVKVDPEFLRYYSTHQTESLGSVENRIFHLLDNWRSSPNDYKGRFKTSRLALREDKLNWKTSIVMDYIYYTCGTHETDYSFDWRADMVTKTKGYNYFKQFYMPTFFGL